MMTHHQLCERAAAWLRSNQKCDPVLTRVGSTAEVPDAIGWALQGRVVIECKTSRADFLNDKKKYTRLKHPEHGWTYRGKTHHRKELIEQGYIEEPVLNMGCRRFFMCEPGIIEAEDIAIRHSDHGLIYVVGRRVKVIVPAPQRISIDFVSEIRYLRYALLHVRNNLLRLGCAVDLDKLAMFFGSYGIQFPESALHAVSIPKG